MDEVKVEGEHICTRLLAEVFFVFFGASDDIDDETTTLEIHSDGSGQG